MAEDILAGRLLKGERMLWSGRPKQGLLFTPRDAFLVPFSLLWCGFMVFWLSGVSRSGAPWFFLLWGAIFAGIGLYFLAGRFLVDAWIRRGVTYAVTDRRVLIARAGPFQSFTAVGLGQLPDAQLTEGAQGRGTIRFGPAAPIWGNRGFSGWTPSLDSTPQFLAIENVRTVFDLVQQARDRAG